jgi:hypothetical protein
LAALAAGGAPDLVGVAEEAYRRAGPEWRQLLSWLLARLPGGGESLIRLVGGATGAEAADLLASAVGCGARLPGEDVRRLLADAEARPAAVDASGLSGDLSFVPVLVGLLDDPVLRRRAVLALGRLGAVDCAVDIAARMRGLSELDHETFAVALELMATGVDPRVPVMLREWLARAPDEEAWAVHHALVCLTGRDPFVAAAAGLAGQAQAVRQAWAGFDATGPPRPEIRNVVVADAARAGVSVHDGLGLIGIDYDPPVPGSSWPRWDKSLHVAGQPLYRVGSDCGTCETALVLIGWTPAVAAAGSQRLRRRLADLAALSTDLIDDLTPLLRGLSSGHYVVHLLDLDLERVADPRASWWVRRQAARDDPDAGSGPDSYIWPGTEHYQLRRPVPGQVPTYGSVLPSRPLDGLDPSTVTGHTAAVRAGARPAALLLGWTEHREVQMTHEERFLIGVVLDGHHKLAAYTQLQVPARAVLLTRVEDNWGPPEDPTRWLTEVTTPLLAPVATTGPAPGAPPGLPFPYGFRDGTCPGQG